MHASGVAGIASQEMRPARKAGQRRARAALRAAMSDPRGSFESEDPASRPGGARMAVESSRVPPSSRPSSGVESDSRARVPSADVRHRYGPRRRQGHGVRVRPPATYYPLTATPGSPSLGGDPSDKQSVHGTLFAVQHSAFGRRPGRDTPPLAHSHVGRGMYLRNQHPLGGSLARGSSRRNSVERARIRALDRQARPAASRPTRSGTAEPFPPGGDRYQGARQRVSEVRSRRRCDGERGGVRTTSVVRRLPGSLERSCCAARS